MSITRIGSGFPQRRTLAASDAVNAQAIAANLSLRLGTMPVLLAVRDSAGNPIPAASFFIDAAGTGTTDSEGNASLSLNPGTYTVRVAPAGSVLFPIQQITVKPSSALPIANQTQIIQISGYGYVSLPSAPGATYGWAIQLGVLSPITAGATGTSNIEVSVQTHDAAGVVQDATLLLADAALVTGTPPDASAPANASEWHTVAIIAQEGSGLLPAPPRYVVVVPVGANTDFPLAEGEEVTLYVRVRQGSTPAAQQQTIFPIVFTPA